MTAVSAPVGAAPVSPPVTPSVRAAEAALPPHPRVWRVTVDVTVDRLHGVRGVRDPLVKLGLAARLPGQPPTILPSAVARTYPVPNGGPDAAFTDAHGRQRRLAFTAQGGEWGGVEALLCVEVWEYGDPSPLAADMLPLTLTDDGAAPAEDFIALLRDGSMQLRGRVYLTARAVRGEGGGLVVPPPPSSAPVRAPALQPRRPAVSLDVHTESVSVAGATPKLPSLSPSYSCRFEVESECGEEEGRGRPPARAAGGRLGRPPTGSARLRLGVPLSAAAAAAHADDDGDTYAEDFEGTGSPPSRAPPGPNQLAELSL